MSATPYAPRTLDTSPKRRGGDSMMGDRLWTADGRSLQLRHLDSGEVRLSILGRQGGVQADTALDEGQRKSLIDLLTQASVEAAKGRTKTDRDLDRILAVNRMSGILRCGMGHPLQGPNVTFGPDGDVRCARCMAIRDEEWAK